MNEANIVSDLLHDAEYSGFQYTGIYSLFFDKGISEISRRFQVDFCLGICHDSNSFYYQLTKSVEEQDILAQLVAFIGGDVQKVWIDSSYNLYISLSNRENTEDTTIVALAKYDINIVNYELVDLAWEIREIDYEATKHNILFSCFV